MKTYYELIEFIVAVAIITLMMVLDHINKYKPREKKKNTVVFNNFHQMIWDDYTPQEIAKELKVNPNIIKEYFVTEGLIEE